MPESGRSAPAEAAETRSLRALDWLNFFLADVQSGLGPFLAILIITLHWNAADIGVVMTIPGIATLVARTPAGALIDATRRKRLVIMLAAGIISSAAHFVTVARGFTADGDAAQADQPSGFRTLLTTRKLLIFIVAITLWQLGNAAMLPIVGRKLALNNSGEGTLFMSALIVVAQAVMVPMSLLVGHRADRWGRRAIFLAGFAALPIRGVLFSLAGSPWLIVAIQVLDGVGAGIFGTLFPVVIADLTRGTGRYNVTLGAATTVEGVGAAFGTTVAGFVIVIGGYSMAFLVLAAIALATLLIFLFFMPETKPAEEPVSAKRAAPAPP